MAARADHQAEERNSMGKASGSRVDEPKVSPGSLVGCPVHREYSIPC
jgi:hypothetical protein